MRNLIALILLTATLHAAPRLVSPERPVGDPTPLNNTLVTGPIDIASSPDSIIAAWSDPRLGATRHLFATRLDDQGAALDPYGIPVGYSQLDQELLRVAWDGQRYLFFWSSGDAVWVSTMDNQEKKLFAASTHTTIDYAPGLLLANGDQVTISAIDDQFKITNTQVLDAHGRRARLVSNGAATLAVWIHDFDVPVVMAQRVDGANVSGIPLQIGPVSGPDAQIATGPALLAYADLRTVHVLDVQPNGVITPRVTYEGLGIESIAATSDGGFIAAANRQLRRYDAAGTLVDSISIDGIFKPHLTSAHGNVLAVAIGQGPVSYVWRAPQVRTISSIAPVQTQPRLASDGTNALMIWKEELPSSRLVAQLISAAGQPLRDRLELPAPAPGEVPVVGFDGTTYVLIRTTPHPGHLEISAQRITRDGALDGPAFLVADSQAKIRDVTITGNTVAWIDEGSWQPRVRWTTLESRTPMFWNPASDIAVASDGSDMLIAATSPMCGVSTSAMLALPIVVTNECVDTIAMAGNGNRWLVVYGDEWSLTGRFLLKDGSPIGEPFILLGGGGIDAPHVVWDGDAFVVTSGWGPALEIMTVSEASGLEHHAPLFNVGPQQNGDVAFVSGTALIAYTHPDEKTKSSRLFTASLSRPRVRPVR